jgi:hypothetical protein
MKNIESFLRWVSIILFTVLAIVVTIPVLAMIQNAALRRLNPFTVMVLGAVLFWFIVVRFLLQDLDVRGHLSGGVKRFYERVFAHPIQAMYSVVRRNLNTLTRRLVLAGILIAGLVAGLTQVSQFEIIGWTILTRPFIPVRSADMQPPQHTRYLVLLTGDNNRREYLQACLKIARDLKQAGARVVVFELPGIPRTEENEKLLAEIDATGIVVFGVRPYETVPRFVPPPAWGERSLSWGAFTYQRRTRTESPFIHRFKPYGYYVTIKDQAVPDVALTVVRKFRGIEADVPIVQEGRTIHTGLGTLTVDAEGTLYSFEPARVVHSNVPVMVDLNTEQEGLRYRLFPTHPFPSTSPPPPVKEIDSFLPVADFVKDKVVLVPWLEWYGEAVYSDVYAYMGLIEQMLSGQVTRRFAEWDLLLAVFLIAINAAFARWLRGLYAVPIMALAGVAAFYGCVWLVDTQNTLVNPAPAVLATMLSMATFPLIRFAWTMHATEPQPAIIQRTEPTPVEKTAQRPVMLSGKRLSLSPRMALVIMLALIVSSVGGTVLWLEAHSPKPRIEVIYLPTMPTVEVQGYYFQSGN